MTEQEFKNEFICKLEIREESFRVTVITTAIRRCDQKPVDSAQSSFDIQETNEWIKDSHSSISASQWNWEKILDITKRYHIDCFAQRGGIKDFFPLDKLTVPHIDDYYQK